MGIRAVVQRCAAARVRAAGRTVGEIGAGLVAFVGIARGDGPADIRYLADKLSGLRVFPDPDAGRRMSLAGSACLLVPNFTVCGDVRRGKRPDFTGAAPPDEARGLFAQLAEAVRARGMEVATGEFGADMEVEVTNDGPVTLLLDSRRQF